MLVIGCSTLHQPRHATMRPNLPASPLKAPDGPLTHFQGIPAPLVIQCLKSSQRRFERFLSLLRAMPRMLRGGTTLHQRLYYATKSLVFLAITRFSPLRSLAHSPCVVVVRYTNHAPQPSAHTIDYTAHIGGHPITLPNALEGLSHAHQTMDHRRHPHHRLIPHRHRRPTPPPLRQHRPRRQRRHPQHQRRPLHLRRRRPTRRKPMPRNHTPTHRRTNPTRIRLANPRRIHRSSQRHQPIH